MKLCIVCKQIKRDTAFWKKLNAKDKLQPYCKVCNKKKWLIYYHANKENLSRGIKAIQKRGVKKRTQFIMDYLKNKKCVDCGEANPLVLQFDHQRDKIKSVMHMVAHNYSLKKIKKEITKCQIRCANCHMIKTGKERNYMRINLI